MVEEVTTVRMGIEWAVDKMKYSLPKKYFANVNVSPCLHLVGFLENERKLEQTIFPVFISKLFMEI